MDMEEGQKKYDVAILLHSGGVLGPYRFAERHIAIVERHWLGLEEAPIGANYAYEDGWLMLDLAAVVGFDKHEVQG